MIKSSVELVLNDLNSSSYRLENLSDPDLTDTELELIEKEQTLSSSHRGSFSRSQSLNLPKFNSIEHEPPEELKFEYESEALKSEPHIVANAKGWHKK